MTSALDTNVLLDLLIPGAQHARISKQALDRALERGGMVIAPIVYAELASQFATAAELDRFLDQTGIRVVEPARSALVSAASAWRRYLGARQSTGPQCPACGTHVEVACPGCGEPLRWRQHVLPDFLVGAHATKHADRLVSRDRGFYRTWFPELDLVDPSRPTNG